MRYALRLPDGRVKKKILFMIGSIPPLEVHIYFTVLHEPGTEHSVVPIHTLKAVEIAS